ncbi:hypothetical protein MNBD_CHLOROFLEXI01-4289, partial [hydrothermal vent metagenome]
MQEDFIEDDFVDEEGSSNRRPFLIAAGVLVSSLILMGVCTAFFLLTGRAAERNDQVAAIETRNAEVETSNDETRVALRVSLTETAEAMPTNTPEPTAAPTETPAPNTPTPTSTPVIEDKNGEITVDGSGEDGEGTAEDNGDTAAADDEENGDGTTGSKDDGDAAATPISALNETGNGSNDALPETG